MKQSFTLTAKPCPQVGSITSATPCGQTLSQCIEPPQNTCL